MYVVSNLFMLFHLLEVHSNLYFEVICNLGLTERDCFILSSYFEFIQVLSVQANLGLIQ